MNKPIKAPPTITRLQIHANHIAAATKVRVHNALPGSEPREFCDHRHGECKWPLDDKGPGNMDRMLICCLPAVRDGRNVPQNYCATHTDMSVSEFSKLKRHSSKELIRSLRSVR